MLLGVFLGLGVAGVICLVVGLGVAGSAFTRLSFFGALYEAGGGLIAVAVGVLLLWILVALCRLTVKGLRYLWNRTAK